MPKSNIDPQEIDKFSEYGDTWWDQNGSAAPLHKINPLRTQFIDDIINCNHQRILDVGCGGGILTEALAKKGAAMTGIDATENAIETATQHAKHANLSIEYIHSTIESHHDTVKTPYDAVTCMEMLEHVPNPAQIVAHCAALTKDNGYAFFSTLNRNVLSFALGIIGAEYVLNLVPKGTHSYEKFIKPSELCAWATPHNLSLIKTIGITYNPLNKQFRTTRDISINYIACFQKQQTSNAAS